MYGNGHLVLSESDIYHYKQSTYYGLNEQFTIKWNDPEFNIWWPVKNPILSLRDEKSVNLVYKPSHTELIFHLFFVLCTLPNGSKYS